MTEKEQALREPRAGDVWVSKRMTRMVLNIEEIWICQVDRNGDQMIVMFPHEFRRWARTATLVCRGKR